MEFAEAGCRVVGEVDEGAGECVGDAVGGDVWVVVLLVLRFLGTKRGGGEVGAVCWLEIKVYIV